VQKTAQAPETPSLFGIDAFKRQERSQKKGPARK